MLRTGDEKMYVFEKISFYQGWKHFKVYIKKTQLGNMGVWVDRYPTPENLRISAEFPDNRQSCR